MRGDTTATSRTQLQLMSGFLPNLTDTNEPSTPCPNPFDDQLFAIVGAVAAVSGFLSLLAGSFIAFIIVLFRKYRFFSQRLILYLAITTIIKSMSVISQRVDYTNQRTTGLNHFCVFSGFFSQTSSWMILNAVISITLSLLIAAFFNKQQEKLELIFLFFIFIFPITFTWIPFIQSAYGESGAWCWKRL